MKLQNVINKAISDMHEKGCTSADYKTYQKQFRQDF